MVFSKDSLFVFLGFAIFRVINVFMVQTQFDPDEYWQNLEVSYCYVFGEANSSCPGLTWEWKRQPSTIVQSIDDIPALINAITLGFEGPVRSFISIIPTLTWYQIIKRYGFDSSWMVSRGPLIVNAIFVATVTDWAVWYMSRWMIPSLQQKGQSKTFFSFNYCVYCGLTSWFNAYALTRTYSNSLETALIAFSMVLVSPELLEASSNSIKASWRTTVRACLAFFLGGICSAIRFTCLTAYIPMGCILAWKHRTHLSKLLFLFGVCALPGILGLLLTILFDRIMYGFWAIPVLGNLQFNVIQGNGSLYGSHPFHWYFTTGLPAITGMLFPILIYDFFFAAWNYAKRNLWTIVACYTIAHSMSTHKEFRFLLPMLPTLCLIAGSRLRDLFSTLDLSKRRFLLSMGAFLNLCAIVYLGLFHQRAPIDVNRAILRTLTDDKIGDSGSRFFQLHYLMGCHSTPLLSHLHAPPLTFEPWYLDCSPECRADPELVCESDAFSKNPRHFLQQTYAFECFENDGNDESCSATKENSGRAIPDFIVCNAADLSEMSGSLRGMGMIEVGRFVNGINGIQLGNYLTIGDENLDNHDFSKINIYQDFVRMSLDEIVLFHKRN